MTKRIIIIVVGLCACLIGYGAWPNHLVAAEKQACVTAILTTYGNHNFTVEQARVLPECAPLNLRSSKQQQ